jgi:hypothetical protein
VRARSGVLPSGHVGAIDRGRMVRRRPRLPTDVTGRAVDPKARVVLD